MTGHGDQENAVKAVGLGAYDFYEKPVDTDVLQLIVQRAYQIFELEQENKRLLHAQRASMLAPGQNRRVIAAGEAECERSLPGR